MSRENFLWGARLSDLHLYLRAQRAYCAIKAFLLARRIGPRSAKNRAAGEMDPAHVRDPQLDRV